MGSISLVALTPSEITVRVANPELRVTQEKPLKVEQDQPFVLAQPKPLEIDTAKPIVEGDQPRTDSNAKTSSGDVIRREVTVFWTTKHGPGDVTTGWNYKDGSGGMPVAQYCYYAVLNGNGSVTKVDIASDGSRSPQISASLVPDLEGALKKCQWWHAETADLR